MKSTTARELLSRNESLGDSTSSFGESFSSLDISTDTLVSDVSSATTATIRRKGKSSRLPNSTVRAAIAFFALVATVFNLSNQSYWSLMLKSARRMGDNNHNVTTTTTALSEGQQLDGEKVTTTTTANKGKQRDVDTQGGIATKKKKETARICLMVKHAERYLKEWLDYNLAIGFTDIHVLDNSPEFSLHNWTYQRDKLRIEHFIPNVVNNVTDAGEAQKQQQYGYKHCVEQARADKITWLATFDVDEFLVLHKHDNVLDFMQDTCSARQQHNGSSCGQISINWFTMGSSNRTDYVNVPVTRRFQYGRFQNTVKSIVDPWAVALKEKHFRWSHTFKLAPRRKWFSANGQPVNNRGWKIMVHEEGTLDVAALHHYKYLSKEEWHTKNCVRGDVMGKQQEMKKICNGRAPEPFAGEVFNDDAWQVLRSRVPSYQQYDNVQELG